MIGNGIQKGVQRKRYDVGFGPSTYTWLHVVLCNAQQWN